MCVIAHRLYASRAFALSFRSHFTRGFVKASRLSACPINLKLGLVTPIPISKRESVVRNFLTLIDQVSRAGISYIQLRNIESEIRASVPMILKVKELCDPFGVPLIINDCADVVFKHKLRGVHLGQLDLPTNLARFFLPDPVTMGLTVNTWQDVMTAQMAEVNYLGVQLFTSNVTKPHKFIDPPPWGLEGAKRVINYTRHKVVLIGNITLENLSTVSSILRPGDGIAMAGAISRANNPFEVTKTALSIISKATEGKKR